MVTTRDLNRFEDIIMDFLDTLEICDKAEFERTAFDLQNKFEDILSEFESERQFFNIYDYEEYGIYMNSGHYD